MNQKYNKTMYASFTGLVVQAVVNNFAPLLFLTFQSTYEIPLSHITLLITFNFFIQLLTDVAAIKLIDIIGYRVAAVSAHVLCFLGLVSLGILPDVFSNPLIGLLISVVIYAIGGGLLEVLMSPIVEACPNDNKEKAMSLLHSFYCWGHVGVVLLSTLFFAVVGIENWRILCAIWAIIPLVNAFCFSRVPIATLISEGEEGLRIHELLRMRIFWVFIMIMVCSGASEQTVCQWSSAFAESGLGLSKTVGDLAGPMTFAIAMGITRTLHGKYSENIDIEKAMKASAMLCMITFLMISLSSLPLIGLLGCTLTGVAVGIMWPGTCSMAASAIKRGGVTMFALLALAGDLGCSLGPTVAGTVSSFFGDDLKKGILAAILFPILLFLGVADKKRLQEK